LVGAGVLLGAELRAFLRLARDVEHVLHERLEVVAAGDEVGLAVDLDDDAALLVRAEPRRDLALRRDLSGARGGLDDALLEDDLDGLLHVAAGFHERVLAVAHAGRRTVAELLDLCRSDRSHVISLFRNLRRAGFRERPALRAARRLRPGLPTAGDGGR